MGADFFFFTDPAFLDAQDPTKAFGPAGSQGANDIFRVTHWHAVTAAAPAVAICDGILCAQEDGSGALTLILKPSKAPPFEAPVVSYFIYKGIAKASLLNGDAVLDENDSDANDLTKRVAATWKELNAAVLTGSSAAFGLDRDATFLHDQDDPASKVFTDNDPIERLFTYPHPAIQLPIVSAGDVIGSFGGDCGLEIVLLRLGYRPKLGFARAADNLIAVPSIPATNGGSPWQADDADWLAHWHAKEQALAYLDPAAYFGAFVQAKLYKKSGAGASKVKGSDVYDDLLTTFANKNTAWLDIRNNYGYSYNLFGLYADTLRFVSPADANQTNDVDFRAGLWPLCRLAAADLPGSRRGPLRRTRLRLPAGQATAPAALLSKGFAKQLGAERPGTRAPTIAIADDDPAFLTPIRIAFPALKDGGQEVLSASYTRVNLYERVHPPPPTPAPLGIIRGNYLDGVFRLRDLLLDKDFAGTKLRFDIYPEEVLVDLEEGWGPTYAASVGVAEDGGNITLFAFPGHFLTNRYGPSGSLQLPSWADTSSSGNRTFLAELASTFRYTAVTKRAISPPAAGGNIDTLIVRHAPSISYNPLTDSNSLEDYLFLVFSKAAHGALLAEILADPVSDATLPAFLVMSGAVTLHDSAHDTDYVEVAIDNCGFANGGSNKISVSAMPLTWKVYQYAAS